MKFKTARQLRITPEEHGALVDVLDKLEHQKIPAKLFTMTTVGYYHDCKSPACLKGWGQKLLHGDAFDYGVRHPTQELFYPGETEDCDPYAANRKQGAKALRNFLRTGKPNWRVAMAAR